MKRHVVVAALAACLALPASLALPQAKPPAEDPVVAKIDNLSIRRSDVEMARLSLPANLRQVPLEAIYPRLLEKVIERKLATIAARKRKLDEGEIYKRQLAFLSESVLEQLYFNSAIDAQLTEDKLRQRFARAMAGFKGEEEVSARHILVETEAEARAAIKALEGGADFARLARDKSVDPTAKENSGDLGYFTHDRMVKDFSDAAFALKVGQVSKPVKSPFGWHVILLEGRRQAPPPSYEEAIDELRSEMAQEVIQETLEKLRAGSKIERFGLDGKPVAAPIRQ
jgi:peptidyl-prolyl cis-trans isomerase C